jgi:SAM-dependent methyltransferase
MRIASLYIKCLRNNSKHKLETLGSPAVRYWVYAVLNPLSARRNVMHRPPWKVGAKTSSDGTGLMGFYAKHVLPHIIDLAMRNKEAARLRAAWVPKARGEVVEIGIGSGLNLPLYSSEVRRVYGVDPSLELQQMARRRATAGGPAQVEFLLQSAEEPLPLPDASMDTVVMTWTLCSIPEPQKALEQMRRVLKQDGRLIFLEHGRSPDSGVALWQDRLTPLWRRVTGGCHLNRRIDELLLAAGFQIAELRTSYLPGPRWSTYMYQGVASLAHAGATEVEVLPPCQA